MHPLVAHTEAATKYFGYEDVVDHYVVLSLDFVLDLAPPPNVLLPVDETLNNSNGRLRLLVSLLLLVFKRLLVAALGSEVFEYAIDEWPLDVEHGCYLLGHHLVCKKGSVDLEQLVT